MTFTAASFWEIAINERQCTCMSTAAGANPSRANASGVWGTRCRTPGEGEDEP